MDRAHLPEGGFRSLLGAGMPIRDDQLNPSSPRYLRFSNNPDQNISFSDSGSQDF